MNAHAQSPIESVVVDANAPAKPFPHFWEQMFGSGRAILSLRRSYRKDLREVKKVTGFRYVRFHTIFHDEVGVYDEDEQGHPLYNFSYVEFRGAKPDAQVRLTRADAQHGNTLAAYEAMGRPRYPTAAQI